MPKGRWSRKKLVALSVSFLFIGALSGIGIYHLVVSGDLSWLFGEESQGWGASVEEFLENARGTSENIAAVTSGQNPEGVILPLAAKVDSGDGLLYVSIDPMLVGFQFQDAGRKAVKVASQRTDYPLDDDEVGLKNLNVYFMVANPLGEKIRVQALDGPSAGAATTLAMIAILENKEIKDGYVITGTIQDDGSIGSVGGVFYKAKAASEAGATHFLVPQGQSEVWIYKPVVRRFGRIEWWSYEPKLVDLNEWAQEHDWNLEILEVKDIGEAENIMLE